ncbi:MAG: M60 family metallopeptidase [Dysgonamonadaceae bacterium]|jgi:hypothetical protein|nr:M60 family metallopeptidase [Dysgonamonadaceae bacterium]
MKKTIFYLLCCMGASTFTHAQEAFLNLVPTINAVVESIPDDKPIRPARATASEAQSNEGITRAYDGNLATIYHSRWSGTSFPVTLSFMFSASVSQIDYLVYYPRTEGSNGNFKQFELWYSLRGDGLPLIKYGDFDFEGRGLPSQLRFDTPLLNPDTIRFVVKSGENNFVSCAEMEFYQADTSLDLSFLTDIFADPACSELNPDVTAANIATIPNTFFRKLASDLLNGNYDREFRVQEYRAWEHPDRKAALNKTAAYSLRDNPAGIYVSQGECLMVLVGDTREQRISLLTQNLSSGGWDTQKTYPLQQGLNKIRIIADGLVYVQYYDDRGNAAPKIKINFVTGAVNGYFDSRKHQAADWQRLLDKAVAADFDVLGEFVHLTFPVSAFKKLTDGKAYINNWDQLMIYEHEFMGLYKYLAHQFQNRMYCHADYNPEAAYMYATSYRTGYSHGTWNELIAQNWHRASVVWGPAHEVGHINQVRPDMKWLGMAEVTNNIYSLHVQTSFGNASRLETDNVYSQAFARASSGVAHQDLGSVWYQLAPFWQLKLYLSDVLGKKSGYEYLADFYKDLFHYFMITSNQVAPSTDGDYQLNFVRKACDVAQLDLTEFFEFWGFLTPVNKEVDDYGSGRFIVTQTQIDALKTEIAAKKYPKPPRDFTRITDSNKNSYK